MTNRTLFTGDNAYILRGLNAESVDLIYLDPPFNSNRNYEAPIGSEAAGAAFRDTWTLSDVDLAQHGEIAERSPALYSVIDAAGLAHGKGMKSYLIMMGVRLLEMRRILKPTGSIYLHCDPTASHYLKAVMDCVFGRKQFRNEIVWCYTRMSAKGQRQFNRVHDTILWYAAGDAWTFNVDAVRLPYAAKSKAREGHALNKLGSGIPKDKVCKLNPLGKFPEDWWQMPYLKGKERCGYPTQKPLALLERIIRASSDPGDTVLDPFCGCATTLVAAEKLDRHWIGCDLSPLAVRLIKQRLERECGGIVCEVNHRTDIPRRTDQGPLPDYRTHKHTLYGRQEGVCTLCETHFPFRNLSIDHVQPRAKGGTDHIDNLQLLCPACNSLKGTKSMAEARAAYRRQYA